MKMKLNSAVLILFVFLVPGFYAVRAQQNGVQHASDFTSVEYYAAPRAQQMKSRLSGAEAQPLSGGLLAIKQLNLESFDENGHLEWVVSAPDCVYDTQNGTANSSGHLQLAAGDGKFRVEGDGFLWRRNDSSLNISNRVQTVIDTGSAK